MAIKNKTWLIHITSTTQIPISTSLISVMLLDQMFRNGNGRQSAKYRHFAMQNTTQMWETLVMFSMQYEKNSSQTVGADGI